MSDWRAFCVAVATAASLLTFTATVAQDSNSVADVAPAEQAGVTPPAAPVISPPMAVETAAAGETAALVGSQAAVSTAPLATLPVAAAAATSGAFAGGGSGHFELADRVVVRKSTRKLLLMRADRVVAEYPIRLGLNPVGPKEREGDFRTPEGSYWLARRNQSSDFFLSIEVSYPNDNDRSRAQRRRAAPGGSIMIHGQPNFPRKPADYYVRNDWTDGCIAVSNSDMVDIWLRTRVGLPIEIRP